MQIISIAVIVGSLRRDSLNRQLADALDHLNVPTLGQPEAFIHAKQGFFDADGRIGAASLGFVQGWMDHYVAWTLVGSRPAMPPRPGLCGSRVHGLALSGRTASTAVAAKNRAHAARDSAASCQARVHQKLQRALPTLHPHL